MTSFKHKFKLIYKSVLLFSFLFVASCASPPLPWIQTYEGVALPNEQEVKLKYYTIYYDDVIVIDDVIYTQSRNNSNSNFKLNPGIHRIDYYMTVRKRGWSIGSFIIDMKAGHTYSLKNEVTDYSTWATAVTLRDETENRDVRTEHFTHPMSWDEGIQKLQEQYMKEEK